MKKLILIPTILVSGLAPAISLVGCNPQETNPYIVTEAEMEKAIKLEGVQYVQYHKEVMNGGGTFVHMLDNQIIDVQVSPTVYYSKERTSNGFYYEEYVIKKNDGTYWRYYRDSEEQENWNEESANIVDFITVELIGINNYNSCFTPPIEAGSSYSFDDINKCYLASYSKDHTSGKSEFYFKNKGLIELFCSSSNNFGSRTETTTFTYDQITPEPPVNIN